MAWTMPPWTWPSTSKGLMTLPQSSTATYFLSLTSPVSRSISTTQMCVPNGKVKLVGSKKVVASRPGSTPGGSVLDVGGADKVVEADEFFRVGLRINSAVAKRHFLRSDFQNVRRDFRQFVAELFEALIHRCSADGGGTTAECANAIGHLASVAVDDENIVGRDAEHVRGDLREAGFLALAVRR